jgi:hypothetical protein
MINRNPRPANPPTLPIFLQKKNGLPYSMEFAKVDIPINQKKD